MNGNVLNEYSSKLIDTNKPLRIAHIMGKMMSGGVESVVMNYYRHINRELVQFDFIIDEDSTIVPYDEIESFSGKIHKIPPYQKPIIYHKALVKLFQEYNYSIVHSHINSMSVFPLFAAKCAKVPVRIAHSHSTAGKGEFIKNIIKYTLRPFAKIFPTHYCACSEHAGRWLFGNKLYDSGKVMLVRNAIDISKFTFDPQIRQVMRVELDIADKFVIIHVGRFMKQKNHSFLIDIFSQICKHDNNSILLLVGEGELEHKIRDKVERLGITKHVLFLGVRNDVDRLLQAADVFVLPSLYEGLSIVAIEAQATGLWVVASEEIPKEAKISEVITYISLSQPPEKWAETIITSSKQYNRATPTQNIYKSGYDICYETEALKDYYMST
jgi:glycosyltransferase EpsF